MIKTIIFDNNGVLTTSCEEGAVEGLIDYLGVSKERFFPVWNREAEAVDEGKIKTEKFLQNVVNELNPGKDLEVCQRYYWHSYEPKLEVREFAKSLKKKFEIAFLTNFGDHFWTFDKRWKLEQLFDKDKMFVSADLKMVKPHPDIYYAVLARLGRKPEEVVFIDDKKDNIDTALKVGMYAIQFKSLKQVEKDLENILEHQPSMSS